MRKFKSLLTIALLFIASDVFGVSYSGSLTTTGGTLGPLYLRAKESATYSLSNFGTASVFLEKSADLLNWERISTHSINLSSTTIQNRTTQPYYLRFRADSYTDGPITATIADVDGDILSTVHTHPYQSEREVMQINDLAQPVFPNGIASFTVEDLTVSDDLTVTDVLTVGNEILLDDGADGDPAFAWTAAPTLGLYRIGGTATGVSGVLGVADGLVTAPGLVFSGDLNTGIYRPAADGIALVGGGSALFDGRTAAGTITIGASGVDDIYFAAASATAVNMYHSQTNSKINIYGTTDTSRTHLEINGNSSDFPYDFRIVNGSHVAYHYDDSASTIQYGHNASYVHTFKGAEVVYDMTAGGNVLLNKAEATGTLEITADDATGEGANVLLYGAGHANAGDAVIRNATTNVLEWDQSAATMFVGNQASDVVQVDGSLKLTDNIEFGSTSVSLTADDQAVTITNETLLIMSSDNATAANRTFTLSGTPVSGQMLILYWNSANEGQLADTGTVLLTAAWEPTNIGSSLVLIYDGTNWSEVSRSAP